MGRGLSSGASNREIYPIFAPMTWENILLALGIGLSTGFINTLAGSGSLVTLPFLIFLGLPANVANGTNRVSILLAAFIGMVTLQRKMRMNLRGTYIYIIPAVLSAMAGAWLAAELQATVMQTVIGIVMTIMLIPLLLNPKRWLREVQGDQNPRLKPLLVFIVLAIGFYGGFIQAGMGVIFLTAFVLIAKYTLPQANILKNLIVFLYTIPVLAIFIYNDQVNWEIGGIMALGQGTGAWVAGTFAGKSKKAAVLIHRLLIVMVVASALKLFGVVDWAMELLKL